MEYGLIGEHLGHSWSAEIHAQIADYKYELCELAPSELGPFLKSRHFKGLNVTIPYKEAVIPFLDELAPEAQAIGAVNTILHSDGKLIGFNTDYFGFSTLAAHTGINFSGKSVLILGAGGAAKAVRAVAANEGASRIINAVRAHSTLPIKVHSSGITEYNWKNNALFCDEFVNRAGNVTCQSFRQPCIKEDLKYCSTAENKQYGRQNNILENVSDDNGEKMHSLRGIPYAECLYENLRGGDYNIIVNATPVGMYPDDGHRLLNLNDFSKLCGVLDCVYNPGHTLLVKDAKKLGVPADGGLLMLVAQAVRASAIFTGKAWGKSAGEVVELSQVGKIYEYMRKMHNFAPAFD